VPPDPGPDPEPIPIPEPDPSPDPAPATALGDVWEVCKCKGYFKLTYEGKLRCDRCGEVHDRIEKLEDMISELLEKNREVTSERDHLYTLLHKLTGD
jgi:hypothetical protein